MANNGRTVLMYSLDAMATSVQKVLSPHLIALRTQNGDAHFVLFPHADEAEMERALAAFNEGVWEAIVAHNSGTYRRNWPVDYCYDENDGTLVVYNDRNERIYGLTAGIDERNAGRLFAAFHAGWMASIEAILKGQDNADN